MAATKYTYNVSSDFPNSKVNLSTIQGEITSSSIVIALERIDSIGGFILKNVLTGGSIDIWFKDALSAGDKTILDGDVAGPAGGLIAAHDNSSTNEVQNVSITNEPKVGITSDTTIILVKPPQNKFGRIYLFSCDFTKKETFYVNSSGTLDSFQADGIQQTFDLTYGSGNGSAIIDLSHGKISEEELVTTSSGTSYIPIVKINGAVQNEREAFETTGGHYTIDYIAGKLNFIAIPPSGNTVTIEYHVSGPTHGPCILAGPPAGKKWILNAAEMQFSKDIDMTDSLLQNVIVDVPIFDGSGNYLFTAYDQKAAQDAVYKTIGSFLDYTYGSYPVVPALGGSTRGTTQDTIILRWEYLSSMELPSSLNARMKVWTKHNRAFKGERATVTVYGIETDE